ncbi:hypothetical protein H0H93_015235, partial [Arthromyces matolae]
KFLDVFHIPTCSIPTLSEIQPLGISISPPSQPAPASNAISASEISHPVRLGQSHHPSEHIIPVKPPLEDFTYNISSDLPIPEQVTLEPPPLPEHDENHNYPLSPVYHLVSTNQYSRGYIYAATYRLSALATHREALLNLSLPPNVEPTYVDGRFKAEPLPAMVQMIPGVPFVYFLDGDPTRPQTQACLQTLESLKIYPDYQEILALTISLSQYTWGCPSSETSAAQPPIYDLMLKQNDRSNQTTAGGNGSFSIATTVIKGEGQGVVAPAVQVNTPEAEAQIGGTLRALQKLTCLLLPKCVSCFEWEMVNFLCIDNNVVTFGGLEPHIGTSCQINVSSLGDKLEVYIGHLQARIHVDGGDYHGLWTVFHLFLRAGPTSDADPGPFLLTRPGLYIQEHDVWYIALCFKGNDPHGGFAPQETVEDHNNWISSCVSPAWNLVGPQNRVGYVCYPSQAAFQRSAGLNMMPHNPFGNLTAQPHRKMQTNFASHGEVILGGFEAKSNRLVRELVASFWNGLQSVGAELNMDLDHLMSRIQTTNPSTGYHAWYQLECSSTHMNITRNELKTYRKIRATNTTSSNQTTFQHLQTKPSNIPLEALNEDNQDASESKRPVRACRGKRKQDEEMDTDSNSDQEKGRSKKKKAKKGDTIETEKDEEEYEVEKILDRRLCKDDVYEWQIKWLGYDETTWEVEDNLQNCVHLLREYEKQLPYNDHHQELYNPKSSSTLALASKLELLDNILDAKKLRLDLTALQTAQSGSMKRDLRSVMKSSIQDAFTLILKQNQQHLDIQTSMVQTSETGLRLAFSFERVCHSVSGLPMLAAAMRVNDILTRAIRWKLSRSLIVVYYWVTQDAETLVSNLLYIHKTSGYAGLQQYSPSFADLVDHIVQYAISVQTLKQKGKTPPQSSKILTGPPRSDLKQLPKDLYGLISFPSPGTFPIPTIVTVKKTLEDVYLRSATCLKQTFEDHILLPHLKSMDDACNSSRRGSTKDKLIIGRAVTRGAILACIAEACGSDDIFACSALQQLLTSPGNIFDYSSSGKEDRIAAKIVNSSGGTLAPVLEYIQERLKQEPEIIEASHNLAEVVQEEISDLHRGERSHTSSLNPPSNNQKSSGKSRNTQQPRAIQNLNPASICQGLFPTNATPTFALPALILREALARKRQRPPVHDKLFRVLTGLHPTLNTTIRYNPDQTDPFREFNEATSLLLKHLPGKEVTAPLGLANILSFMGTGQGSVTRGFLANTQAHYGRFFADNVEQMVSRFQNQIQLNNTSSEKLAYDDQRIWGTPSTWLSAQPVLPKKHNEPSRRLSLHEKFDPYFSQKISDLWAGFLGPMLGQDPETYTGYRHTWKEALEMVQSAELTPFGKGLTCLQFANNLVFLGIVLPPEPLDVATWISRNKDLGAVRGLQKLGFNLTTTISVQSAFMSVYNHLDSFMTAEDKADMGFGAIFVEHLLCKVSRWFTRLEPDTARPTGVFETMGKDVLSSEGEWSRGANLQDSRKFPFPLRTTLDAIKATITNVVNAYTR